MSLELSKYLKLLRKEANRLERTDINNTLDNSSKAKFLVKIVITIVAAILVAYLKDGFSTSFVAYVSSVLSILVGLFITALIFSFDKFYAPNRNSNKDSRAKLFDKQDFNFSKKFAYITGYTIVLSIFTLVLLSLCALFGKQTRLNIYTLSFCLDCISSTNYLWLKLAVLSVFNLIQRFLILYWVLKIMYNTLFIVSSMVQYMATKIERNHD